MHPTSWPTEQKPADSPHRRTDHLFTSAEELAEQIKGKIKRVTQGRVKNLDVFLTGTHVVLEGLIKLTSAHINEAPFASRLLDAFRSCSRLGVI